MISPLLLLLAPAAPMLAAAICLTMRRPRRLLPFAAAPALLASLVSVGAEVALPEALLGASLRLDTFGAVFLGFGALVWVAAGAFAIGYLAEERERGFCFFWCLTLLGVVGAFCAADAATFYVSFAFLSLAAFPLIAHEGSAEARRAARIYIALAVFGEICLMAGLILAATAADSIRIDDMRAAIAHAPTRDLAILALVAGLGLKAGLAPLHVWLPLAHSAAPVPASAVLSGVIVKAGVVGLVRFLPAETGLTDWGQALMWAGLLTAYLGALLGVAQARPKPALAYSTMSQMGLLAAIIAAAWQAPDTGLMHGVTALYAAHHGLAKGALFLGVGLVAASGGSWARFAIIACAFLGASLAGLPFTGGALAKLAAKGPFGDGVAGAVASLASIGTMLVMLRFIALVSNNTKKEQMRPPLALLISFAVLGLSAFALPWFMFAALSGLSPGYAFVPENVWSGLWPILTALALAALAMALRIPPLIIPAGDVVVLAEAMLRRLRRLKLPTLSPPKAPAWRPSVLAGTGRNPFEMWPVAASALVAVAILAGVLISA